MGNKEHERQIGDEDVLAHVDGPRKYQLNTDFYFDTNSFNYAKRVINAANPTTPAGTVSETLTALYSILLNGTENYRIFTGFRPATGSIKGEIGKAWRGSLNGIALTHALPNSAHGLTTPTFVSTKPALAIWDWKSGGTSPITVEAAAVEATSLTVNFNRGSQEDHTFGNEDPHSSQPYDREVTYELEMLWTGTTIEGYYNNNTLIDIVATLRTAAGTLTLTDCSVNDYTTTDIVANGKESIKEKITGVAKTCSLA